MGLLDHFLPPPDPARGWSPNPGLLLECRLDEPSFCGVRLGDAVAALSRFGPPENNRPTRDGLYDHPSRGFEIDADEGRVDCFLFRWDAMDPAKHFKGSFSRDGRPVRLDSSTGEGDLRTALGEPYWIDDDGSEKLYFYELRQGTLEWQVEFVRGRLAVLTILTPGLLADPEVRADYHVTRPWPPPL